MTENDVEEASVREMNCELNILSRSDGSAIFSQGDTAVIVSINGPLESKIHNSDIFKAVIEVYFAIKSGQSCVKERHRELIIKQTCESSIYLNFHPREAIVISLQEMENSGSLMATSLNACCLALINSGLPMKFLFAAVNCAVKSTGEIILDPTLDELIDTSAQITFVFDSVEKNLITSLTEGIFTPEIYQECLLKCRKASENIFLYYRNIVTKYTSKD